jgi:hypothetical protein
MTILRLYRPTVCRQSVLRWSPAWPLTWCLDADPDAVTSASQRRRRRITSAPARSSVIRSRRTVSGTSSWGRINGRRSASRGGGWRTSDRSAVTLGSA